MKSTKKNLTGPVSYTHLDVYKRQVLHGRAVCKARNPQCQDCCLKDICKTGKKA